MITNMATGDKFHANPEDCPGVEEHYVEENVIENAERAGSYFTANSMANAQAEWPDVTLCQRYGQSDPMHAQ